MTAHAASSGTESFAKIRVRNHRAEQIPCSILALARAQKDNSGMAQSFSVTDIGRKRTMNQDYLFASDAPVGLLPNLYIVADGMGGHRAGDYASRYAVTQMV